MDNSKKADNVRLGFFFIHLLSMHTRQRRTGVFSCSRTSNATFSQKLTESPLERFWELRAVGGSSLLFLRVIPRNVVLLSRSFCRDGKAKSNSRKSYFCQDRSIAFQEFHFKLFWNCRAVVLLFWGDSVLADIETRKLSYRETVGCEIGHLRYFSLCLFVHSIQGCICLSFNNLQTRK